MIIFRGSLVPLNMAQKCHYSPFTICSGDREEEASLPRKTSVAYIKALLDEEKAQVWSTKQNIMILYFFVENYLRM